MIQLGLTIPLQKHLKNKNLSHAQPWDRRFCWDLHVIQLHGRACLLAVHCSSRYTFTLFDLAAGDWRDLPATFLEGLKHSLGEVDISQEKCKGYLAYAAQAVYTKTHGRTEVAFLNRAWEDVVALDYTVAQSSTFQPLLDAAVNALPRRCAGAEGLGSGAQRLQLFFSTLE